MKLPDKKIKLPLLKNGMDYEADIWYTDLESIYISIPDEYVLARREEIVDKTLNHSNL